MNNCVYNWTGDRKTVRFATANAVKSVTAHEVINNTAAAMLSDTDMTELLEHENIYCADEWAEKQKRISALNRLTKQQQMLLYTEVTGFITRYLELSAAFDTIEAVITELDYHQSAMKGKEGVTLPQSAYV